MKLKQVLLSDWLYKRTKNTLNFWGDLKTGPAKENDSMLLKIDNECKSFWLLLLTHSLLQTLWHDIHASLEHGFKADLCKHSSDLVCQFSFRWWQLLYYLANWQCEIDTQKKRNFFNEFLTVAKILVFHIWAIELQWQ